MKNVRLSVSYLLEQCSTQAMTSISQPRWVPGQSSQLHRAESVPMIAGHSRICVMCEWWVCDQLFDSNDYCQELEDELPYSRPRQRACLIGLSVQCPVVACLTAVREVLGSNRAVGSCVYRTTTAIYSLGHGLCAPFLQWLGQLSLLPSVGR